jgi:hypothetical protein
VRLLIPVLLRIHPAACRVTRKVHVPRQADSPRKYIVFSNLEGLAVLGRDGEPWTCNKTLQVATFEH